MAEPHPNLSRRHFLQGLGACIALPAFESLLPRGAMGATVGAPSLATTATGAPLRTAFVYFPNGAIPSAWWPTGGTTDFAFGPTLKAMESSRHLLQVVSGLGHKSALAGKDGGGDHARGNSTFLTGARLRKSATELHVGTSIDQAMAQAVGGQTRLPSLELSCDVARQAGACDSGYSCAYQFNISWASPTTPRAAEFNPRLAFERMFGAGQHGERAANVRRRVAEQRSILDFVMDDAKALGRRASARDNDKLDEYLTSVREIESRIQRAEQLGATADPDVETPAGVPAHYGEHIDLMFDLMLLAFQTDTTRVATLQLAHDGSNRSFAEIGVSEGHHDLSHHQNRPELVAKVQRIDAFYAEAFARFLKRLDAVKDVDGHSVLHNSQIVYGSGNADGNRHTHDNLPVLLAGAAGGAMTPNRYLKYNSEPMTNLFLSMAHRIGMGDLQRFGDSTSPLAGV